MDAKSLECFSCDARARGLKVEVSPQESFVFAHEHFICAAFKAGERYDSLRITFVTHEIALEGFLLRRIENALVIRDLAWLSMRPEKFRPEGHDRPFVVKLSVTVVSNEEGEVERTTQTH